MTVTASSQLQAAHQSLWCNFSLAFISTQLEMNTSPSIVLTSMSAMSRCFDEMR